MLNRIQIQRRLCAVVFAAAACCAPARAAEGTALHETRRQPAQLVQPGERLVLLGVTADNHAVYQDGQAVYASALRPGARKQLVGTSPPGVVAFVYTVGRVAFVWTQPDRAVPGFGVSPLTVWSARTGAQRASDRSPIGTFTTSASDDGRHVMYTTRGAPDGSTGDIEFARTDMTRRQTLVTGVPMSFPSGPCRPWGSFVGREHQSHPVALFCEGGATTATLASWSGDGQGRTTLLTGALTQPFFTTTKNGKFFFTALANTRTPVVVSDRGEVRRLEEGVLSRRGFFTSNNDVFYTAFVDLTKTGEIHRAPVRSGSPSFVSDQLLVYLTAQSGSDLVITPPSSPDGRKLAFTSGFDPATGLNDLRLADLVNAGSTVVEASKNTTLSGPLFSADSKYVLYARVDDPSTGNAQLVAEGPQGKLALGAPSLWSHDRLQGSRIAFNDNTLFDNTDFFRSTADLKMVDLLRPTQSLVTVQAQAYLAFYPSHRGRALAFTSGTGPQGPGLYLARSGAQRDDHDHEHDHDHDHDND